MDTTIKKAILINVNEQTIKQIFITDSIDAIHNAVECECFTVAEINETNDVFVDDNGLSTKDKFFNFEGAHQPFAGNGLILGIDHETGESIDTTLNIEEVRAKVTFLTLAQVRTMFK
jgi:hypothetical protein